MDGESKKNRGKKREIGLLFTCNPKGLTDSGVAVARTGKTGKKKNNTQKRSSLPFGKRLG